MSNPLILPPFWNLLLQRIYPSQLRISLILQPNHFPMLKLQCLLSQLLQLDLFRLLTYLCHLRCLVCLQYHSTNVSGHLSHLLLRTVRQYYLELQYLQLDQRSCHVLGLRSSLFHQRHYLFPLCFLLPQLLLISLMLPLLTHFLPSQWHLHLQLLISHVPLLSSKPMCYLFPPDP